MRPKARSWGGRSEGRGTRQAIFWAGGLSTGLGVALDTLVESIPPFLDGVRWAPAPYPENCPWAVSQDRPPRAQLPPLPCLGCPARQH